MSTLLVYYRFDLWFRKRKNEFKLKKRIMKKVKKINIFIPYFLPDKSYGGPISSIFSLSKFLSQFNKVRIYTTALFYDSQKIIGSKLVKKEKFTFCVKRSKNHFRNLFSTLL